FLYIAVGFVLTGIVPFDKLNVPDPIAVGIDAAGVGWLSPVIKLGIIFGLTSVILVMLLAQPRIFRAMAYDGLLPRAAANIHPRSLTPYVSTIISGAVVAVLFQGARDLARGAAGCGDLDLPDVRPAARHLDSARRVARNRACDLFHLWSQAQQGGAIGIEHDVMRWNRRHHGALPLPACGERVG